MGKISWEELNALWDEAIRKEPMFVVLREKLLIWKVRAIGGWVLAIVFLLLWIWK